MVQFKAPVGKIYRVMARCVEAAFEELRPALEEHYNGGTRMWPTDKEVCEVYCKELWGRIEEDRNLASFMLLCMIEEGPSGEVDPNSALLEVTKRSVLLELIDQEHYLGYGGSIGLVMEYLSKNPILLPTPDHRPRVYH